MSDLSLPNTLTPGTPEDVSDVQDNFTAITTWANANIDGDNFTSATNQALGLNETGVVRRNKSIVATEQTTTSATYTTLTTPDQVSNVVLPTDGLLVVGYRALWKDSSGATAARAAIFLGANQIKTSRDNQANPVVAEVSNTTGNVYAPLGTSEIGLISAQNQTPAYVADVTTGQLMTVRDNSTGYGPLAWIFAAAGTYTVSIQFKTSAGTTSVKDRRLWVWTMGFG